VARNKSVPAKKNMHVHNGTKIPVLTRPNKYCKTYLENSTETASFIQKLFASSFDKL